MQTANRPHMATARVLREVDESQGPLLLPQATQVVASGEQGIPISECYGNSGVPMATALPSSYSDFEAALVAEQQRRDQDLQQQLP